MSKTPTASRSVDQASGVLRQLMAGTPMLREAMHHTDASEETLYHVAYNLYKQSRYMDAMRVFSILMSANQMDRRYYKGMAGCLQMKKHYREALQYYAFVSIFDLTDPEPAIHSAECLMALGDHKQARSGLQYALGQARAHERHRRFVDRAEAMLAFLDGESASKQKEPSHG